MELISQADFAKAIKVSRARVGQAIKTGVLSQSLVKAKSKSGADKIKINLELGLKEWANNIDQSKQRDNSKQLETAQMQQTGKSEVGQSNYQKAKGVKEFYQAKIAEIDYQERAGKLVPVNKIKAEAFKMARNLRDTLMAIPEKTSAELVHMNDAREIQIYLKNIIADALRGLDDLNNVG